MAVRRSRFFAALSTHATHRVRRDGLKGARGLRRRDNFVSTKDNFVSLKDKKRLFFVSTGDIM